MKTKITLTILFVFFILKIQAQTPSINETKSTRFYPYSSIVNKEKKIIKERITNIENEIKTLEHLKSKDSVTINKKRQIIESANNELQTLRRDESYDGYRKFYDSIIGIKNDSIKIYFKIIKNGKYSKKELDSINEIINLKRQQLNSIILEKEEKLASLDKFPWVVPTWKKSNRKKFFHDMYNNDTDKTNFLNSFALNSNSNATSVQTELVTDNMWALRISFGSVLSVSSSKIDSESIPEEIQELNKNETEQEAFSRLINGGGNFYLETILPLFTTNQNNGDQITSYTYANLKGAMDIENFNSNIDTSTGNASLGLNSYLGISSDNKKFNFFGILNANYTMGNKAFYNNLGLSKEQAFFNAKFTAGVTILNTLKLTAIINNWASDEKLRSGKIIVGVQILPGL